MNQISSPSALHTPNILAFLFENADIQCVFAIRPHCLMRSNTLRVSICIDLKTLLKVKLNADLHYRPCVRPNLSLCYMESRIFLSKGILLLEGICFNIGIFVLNRFQINASKRVLVWFSKTWRVILDEPQLFYCCCNVPTLALIVRNESWNAFIMVISYFNSISANAIFAMKMTWKFIKAIFSPDEIFYGEQNFLLCFSTSFTLLNTR